MQRDDKGAIIVDNVYDWVKRWVWEELYYVCMLFHAVLCMLPVLIGSEGLHTTSNARRDMPCPQAPFKSPSFSVMGSVAYSETVCQSDIMCACGPHVCKSETDRFSETSIDCISKASVGVSDRMLM
jgi:hypothetical protein